MYIFAQILGLILSGIGLVGSLVCFILIVVQMFQRGEPTMGIVCLVLTFCCLGIGTLVAFIYGWIKHREWKLTNIMYVWTACWVFKIVGYALHPMNIDHIQKLSGF